MNDREEKVLGLIAGVRAGQRTAFSDLLSDFRPLLISQVNRFSGDAALRDELLQDATLALYRAALRFRREEGVSFGTFARVCIANALTSAYRKIKAAAVSSLEELLPYMEDTGEDPERCVITAEETSELYRAAKACLSEYEIRVFLLYIRGYTPRQIAPEVGRTEKSVSNAIGRMLTKLRARLN